jgi:hypothetical protein
MKPPPEPEISLFQKGPVRACRDHAANQIVIKTTEGNGEGAGIEICRLPMDRLREAMAIVALPDLIKAGAAFAGLGIMVMEADPEDPLISHEEDVHVSVADAHRMTDAFERAIVLPERRRARPWHKAKATAPKP